MSRTGRHLRRLQASISGPWDAWLLVRITGWSLVLPLAKSLVPLPRLALFMRPSVALLQRDHDRERSVIALTAWVFKTRPPGSRDNCLERALVTYRYLCRAGARPELVMGVAGGDGGLHGHAWVVVDGSPVHDTDEGLARFEPVLRFESDGTVVRLPRT